LYDCVRINIKRGTRTNVYNPINRIHMKKKQIGLALGSGAMRGYALIPIIKGLEKEGIEIAAVSGSSVGALIGAYYALYGEVDTLFEFSKNLPKKNYVKLVDPNNPKISLIKGEKVKKFLADNFFHDRSFKDTKIPLVICAVDLFGRKPVYMSTGKIVEAVMASISIPGLVPPYRMNHKYYVDGGILDPVPVNPLFDMGLGKVVGANLMGYKLETKKQERDLFPTMVQTFYMMMEQLAKRKGNQKLFMLNLSFKPDPASMLAFYKWKEPYEAGQTAINSNIKSLKNWLHTHA
ncbi:MAG: patatin-like phospholipase family protein, partial [Candidatus Aminicenantes bacterium]